MSFNLSVTGAGGQSVPDKSDLQNLTTKSKVDTGVDNNTVFLLPSSIHNSQELKRAELNGDKVTISDTQMVKAIEQAIKAVQGKTTSLEFSIHQKTRLISVKVLDKNTGELIREIPPEKSLDFVARLWEMAGILVDERG